MKISKLLMCQPKGDNEFTSKGNDVVVSICDDVIWCYRTIDMGETTIYEVRQGQIKITMDKERFDKYFTPKYPMS